MNNRKIGTEYESRAAASLQAKGIEILEKNYRTRFGEIDLIAKDGDCLCFVEVKYRRTKDFGLPEEAVNVKKQNTIRKVASYYMVTHGYAEWTECRFDVIAIEGQTMRWRKNAF